MISPTSLNYGATSLRGVGHALAEPLERVESLGAAAKAATTGVSAPAGIAQAATAPRLLVTHVDPVDKLSLSVRHVRNVGRERGYDMTVARAEDITVDNGTILHKGEPLPHIDGIVVRGGADHTDEALQSLRALEATGVRMTNLPDVIERVSDKGAAAELLHANAIPHPASATIRPGRPSEVHQQVVDAIDQLGTGPLVLKPTSGKGGAGVMFLDRTSTVGLRSVVDTVMPHTAGKGFIVQEWLTQGTGRDLRAYVSTVNGKLQASPIGLERIAAEGQGAANVANGGTSGFVDIPVRLREQALDAAKALDVRYGAVDFIEGPNGWQVVEVNTSPGVSRSVARKLGFDQAELLLDYAAGIAR